MTARRYYDKGLHIAGEMGGAWNAAKQIGSILAPYIDKKIGGGHAGRALEAGVSWGDALHNQVIKRHADVLDEIGDLGRVQSRIAAAVQGCAIAVGTGSPLLVISISRRKPS